MSMQTLKQTTAWSGQAANSTQSKAQLSRQAQAAEAVRRLRDEYIRERLRQARNASHAHHLYLELAARAKTQDCKALYQRLAETEQRHLFRHTMRLKKLGYQPPKFRRTWFTKTWHRVLATCAPTFVHKTLTKMRQGETRRQIELIRRQSDIRQSLAPAGD